MKVVLCAGGTGGHLFPAVALAESLKEKHHDAIIVTDKRGAIYCDEIEDKKVLKNIKFSLKNMFSLPFRILSNLFYFIRDWKKQKPDVIVGFGGIFSIIPIFIAKLYGIKIILFEQNSVVGRANRYLQNLADLKLSAFATGGDWKTHPAPVRKEFFKNSHYKIEGKLKILIIGGSQGAKSFSTIVPQALKGLSEEERSEIEIIQQASHGDMEELKEKYEGLSVKSTIEKFVYEVADAMNNCQLVICRAGASTLSELVAVGRPAVLIPYPKATDNHQLLNAKRYVSKNVGWIVEENSYSAAKLQNIIKQILKDKELLAQKVSGMQNPSLKNAADSFVDLIEDLGAKE